MKRLRIFDTLSKWLFILCLPFLLIAISIGWVANSRWFYEWGFQKFNVGRTTGLADVELSKVADGLVDYYNSGEEYISITVIKDGKPFELFNQREIVHLKDVKGLILLDYRILLITLFYALVYAGICLFWWKDRQKLAWRAIVGSILTLILMLALGIGTLFGFEQLFLQFHLISFTNELWLLDPTKDYLIMLFPQKFFYTTALLAAGITSVLALALGGGAGGYLLFNKKQRANIG
ncbi:MAG: TIGR01906 family membrane protein [Chloroflexota bacterium]